MVFLRPSSRTHIMKTLAGADRTIATAVAGGALRDLPTCGDL